MQVCFSLHFNFKKITLLLFRLTFSFFGHSDSIHESFIHYPLPWGISSCSYLHAKQLKIFLDPPRNSCFPKSLINKKNILRHILSNLNLNPNLIIHFPFSPPQHTNQQREVLQQHQKVFIMSSSFLRRVHCTPLSSALTFLRRLFWHLRGWEVWESYRIKICPSDCQSSAIMFSEAST